MQTPPPKKRVSIESSIIFTNEKIWIDIYPYIGVRRAQIEFSSQSCHMILQCTLVESPCGATPLPGYCGGKEYKILDFWFNRLNNTRSIQHVVDHRDSERH